jgi:hypothetical protein
MFVAAAALTFPVSPPLTPTSPHTPQSGGSPSTTGTPCGDYQQTHRKRKLWVDVRFS